MKFLVDANVLSEPTKPAPDACVVDWLRHHECDLAVNPIILGELEYGILLLPTGRRRTLLEHWFAASVQRLRVLDFDIATAAAWARLLAASALAHELTVATRNTHDFRNARVPIENPFEN